jgi:hypothetical protein
MIEGTSWFFGRGASIASGLDWSVPVEWKTNLQNGFETRDEHISNIESDLSKEIELIKPGSTPYFKLFNSLIRRSLNNRLLTTNWDYLLQLELDYWIESNNYECVPGFLAKGTQGSMVYHLNGSIEKGVFVGRSKILLETDCCDQRRQSYESNAVFNILLESKTVVIIGMSFNCNVDHDFLNVISDCKEDMPIRHAKFIVVEPDKLQIQKTKSKLTEFFPESIVIVVNSSFANWIESGMPELLV